MSRSKKPSYSENMSRWTKEDDQFDQNRWESKVEAAALEGDVEKVKELLDDGATNGYDLTEIITIINSILDSKLY